MTTRYRKVYTQTLRNDLYARLQKLKNDLEKDNHRKIYKSRLTDEAIEDLLHKYENKIK